MLHAQHAVEASNDEALSHNMPHETQGFGKGSRPGVLAPNT